MTKDWQHDFSLPVVSRKLNGFKMTRWLNGVELSLSLISISQNSDEIIK
uniref:Uncharacterized protein n=1 Tax=Wuchereria bancrofti TaxID=6293 RepID=A0AAF5PPF0_WUCBA